MSDTYPILHAFHEAGVAFESMIKTHAMAINNSKYDMWLLEMRIKELLRVGFIIHGSDPFGIMSQDAIYNGQLQRKTCKENIKEKQESIKFLNIFDDAIRMVLDKLG